MLLIPHPGSVTSVRSIEASVSRDGARLRFFYRAEGCGGVVLPARTQDGRADGLWRATCFEAFVGLAGTAYIELNFSPSGEWAAYRFDAPRRDMRNEPAAMEVRVEPGADWFEIEAIVDAPALGMGVALSLTAVIEETGGAKSYWALGHPTGPADFHDRSCFLARVPE